MGQAFGPFNVRAGVLQRSTRFIDTLVRQRSGTTAFNLWASNSIVNAYGTLASSGLAGNGGQLILTAKAGQMAQSPLVQQRGWHIEESRKGQTTFQIDPDDYTQPTASLSDEDVIYLRVQEQRGGAFLAVTGATNTGYAIRGPILIVAPTVLYGSSALVFSFQSIAPLGTNSAISLPPVFDQTVQTPLPLHLVLPRPAATVTIKNLASASTDKLLVCYGLGQSMMEVDPGDETTPTGGGFSLPGVREIILASASTAVAAVPFSIETVIGMES